MNANTETVTKAEKIGLIDNKGGVWLSADEVARALAEDMGPRGAFDFALRMGRRHKGDRRFYWWNVAAALDLPAE